MNLLLPSDHQWLQPALMTAYLHEEIPLTKAMGMTCAAWDGQSVTLAVPLAPNLNHADTAFGGSISSAAILAGYCLMYLMLRERQISNRLLITKSEIEYLRPIDAEMAATARLPAEKDLQEFLEKIQRKRRARLALESQVSCKGLLAAKHSGQYFAMLY
jgi:thioesterase domain-containing protein